MASDGANKQAGKIRHDFSDEKLCNFWNNSLEYFNFKRLEMKNDEAMLPCCREKHILSGYRNNPCSIKYCVKSALHPTNETMNFWTHFLPMVWLLCRHKNLMTELDAHMNDEICYPFIAYSIGCFMLLTGSSFAHLFNSLSPTLRHVCFCCDYGAISAYSVGGGVAYYYYISPPHCHGLSQTFCEYYLPLGVILITSSHALCCHTRFPKRIPFRYVVRTLAYATPFLLISLPALIRLAEPIEVYEETNINGTPHKTTVIKFCDNPFIYKNFAHYENQPHDGDTEKNIDTNAYCHLAGYEFFVYYYLHLTFFALGAVFNMTKFPEKHFEGKFDIVGNSHQWFHVFIALGVVMQSFVIEEGLKDALGRHSCFTTFGHFSESTIWSTVGVMVGCITVFFTIVVVYSKSLAKLYH